MSCCSAPVAGAPFAGEDARATAKDVTLICNPQVVHRSRRVSQTRVKGRMVPTPRKPPPLPEGSIEKLRLALKTTRTKGQYQKALCLWMRAALRMNADQIAVALGMSGSG